jgi:polyisoprenoid-binding protein YceI
MRKLLVIAAMVFAVSPLAADEKKLTGENTKITFVGTKPDGKHEGGFKELTGSASYTGTDLSTLKIKLEIEIESLYSDDAKLTQHLKSPDFFAAKKNPKSKFETTKVEKTGDGYTVTGDFTLNGVTKSISLPATISADGGTLKLTSDFKIDRTQFGMSYGKGKISDDVALKVNLEAK